MGEEINKETFDQSDYDRFRQKLEQETGHLRSLFETAAFDNHSRRLGYELELCLADDKGLPSCSNMQVIETAGKRFGQLTEAFDQV